MVLEPPVTGDTSLRVWLRSLSPIDATLWNAVRVLGSSLVVPMAEELGFRVSSVLFGGLLGRWLVGILAGLCFAVALYRLRGLADAVVARLTSNALIAATVLLAHAWSARN